MPEHSDISESKSILVSRIDGKTTTTELKKLFKPYCRIVEIAIVESMVDEDRILISATISSQNSNAATMATIGRDGIELRGTAIHVSLWKADTDDY